MKTQWGSILLIVSTLGIAAVTHVTPALAEGKSRQKVIDFEDEVVEGVNRRPWDSLSQISEADRKKRKVHLYRKRAGFTSETAESLRAMHYTP